MNFYDNLNNLVSAFKNTPEYTEYMKLKEELKADAKTYDMLKDFKQKQEEVQVSYLNGQEPTKEKQAELQNLYSIVCQNEACRRILECEMRINVILADLQKAVGQAVEELVKF